MLESYHLETSFHSREFLKRAAVRRQNRLRHAVRILQGEGMQVPPELWRRLYQAAQLVEELEKVSDAVSFAYIQKERENETQRGSND